VNSLYFPEKLAGGTRAFVRFRGLLSLEVSLNLLGVWGRSDVSVVSGHLDVVGRFTDLVSGFIPMEPRTMVNACGSVAIRDWGSSDRPQATARFDLRPS